MLISCANSICFVLSFTNLPINFVAICPPIFAPLAGTITAVNMELEDAPELMNSSPYGDGWIVKMTLDDASAVAGLMDAAAYRAEIGE